MSKAQHPAVRLRELIPEGMTVTDLAKHLGVGRVSMSELLNERRSVSLEMAMRLGRAFGTRTRYWLDLQLDYDLEHAPTNPDVKPLETHSHG